ncbi:redoxin domain-containing protein [Polynucleobacter sp.]|jgi:peroxiredoxin (alkyl hydroperoxide reductase subunit C)|uniref:redoxin domain-containing protein n=1 Tax=Polynucleobacter sp. TaxID=2029855 RepID=UPI0037C6E96C
MSEMTVQFPRLNERTPEFSAKTTFGEKKLSDYEGKWLILFSHPADFTPVCTTEFIGFAKAAETFKSMNCESMKVSGLFFSRTQQISRQYAQLNLLVLPKQQRPSNP